MNPTAENGVEAALLRVIIQLVVIITAARVAGNLFRRLGQPAACGDIASDLAARQTA